MFLPCFRSAVRLRPGAPNLDGPVSCGACTPHGNSADAWHSGNWPFRRHPKGAHAAIEVEFRSHENHREPAGGAQKTTPRIRQRPPGRPSRQRESREIGPRRNPRRPRAQHGKSLTAARRPPARQSLRQRVLQVRPNDELIHQPPPDSLQHDVQMGGAKA